MRIKYTRIYSLLAENIKVAESYLTLADMNDV